MASLDRCHLVRAGGSLTRTEVENALLFALRSLDPALTTSLETLQRRGLVTWSLARPRWERTAAGDDTLRTGVFAPPVEVV